MANFCSHLYNSQMKERLSGSLGAVRIARVKLASATASVKHANLELNAACAGALRDKGGSLRDHAAALGFSAPYVHDVINGRRNVSNEFIVKLEGYLS